MITRVVCRDCGKVLKGTPAVRRGFHVPKHRRPDGNRCWGDKTTHHIPAQEWSAPVIPADAPYTPPPGVTPDTTLTEVRAENDRLRAENDRLRAENDRLALLLIEARNPGIDMAAVRASRDAIGGA